jgi:hypothetical protein
VSHRARNARIEHAVAPRRCRDEAAAIRRRTTKSADQRNGQSFLASFASAASLDTDSEYEYRLARDAADLIGTRALLTVCRLIRRNP